MLAQGTTAHGRQIISLLVGFWMLPTVGCTSPDPLRPAAGCFDYARVVVLALPSGEAYFDRETGRRLVNLPVLPDFFFAFGPDGLAPARSRATGKLGYIDRAGNWVIPPRFDNGGAFSEARAWVVVGKSPALIDKAGRWVVKPDVYDSVYPAREGLYKFRKDGLWGFLALDGSVAIPAEYKEVGYFRGGRCFVDHWKEGERYIDRLGRPAADLSPEAQLDTKGRFWMVGVFDEGLAPACIRKEEPVDANRQPMTPEEEEEAEENMKFWGFINPQGKIVVPCVYHAVGRFSGGLAPVLTDDGWGYMDRRGKVVIPPRFEYAHDFRNGVARVSINWKVVCIDMAGRVVIETGEDWEDY